MMVMNIPNREEENIVRKYMQEIPVKLGAMAKELGITVKSSPLLDRRISGQIEKDGDNYTIKINKFEFFQRQRFTLAHEISHFLLHKNILSKQAIKDNILYRSGASQTEEYEANRLAAKIIMPKEKLIEEYQKAREKTNDREQAVDMLADIFQVSKPAMEVRLENCGLLPKA